MTTRVNRRIPTSRQAWEVYGSLLLAIGLFMTLATAMVHGRWPQVVAVLSDGLLWLALAALLRSNHGGVSEWYAEGVIAARHWQGKISARRLERGFAWILTAWGAGLVALGILLATPLIHNAA